MSVVNLHDFNILSKKHHYFMTNNRKNGFPSLKENSSFLKKILDNKSNTKINQINNYSEMRPKKCVRFINDEKIPFRSNFQSPLIDMKNLNNSNVNIHHPKFFSNVEQPNNDYYKFNVNNIRSPFVPNLNPNFSESNFYKQPIKLRNRVAISPDYNQYSNMYSNINTNDSENEKGVLNFKGKKMFNANSFSSFKNDNFISPERKKNNEKESELYRNPEELKKKKEEIYQRKIKRESSPIKRELLQKEKDKEIKNEKININIKPTETTNNNTLNRDKSNEKNKIKVISLNNNIDNHNINKNKIKINNNYKSIDIQLNKESINSNSQSLKILNQVNQNNLNNIKRINKYTLNKTKYNNSSNPNMIPNNKDNYIKNISLKKNIINNKIILPPEKKCIFNNIYITKSTDYIPSKKRNQTFINDKIKVNLNDLRKSKKNDEQTLYTKETSVDKHKNPYNFSVSKKRFIEDCTHESPIIYSNDKKISIRVNTLPNLNETFLGKRPTKEKIKIQKAINLYFDNKKKDNQKNRKPRRKYQYKILSNLEEEKEKTKVEPKTKLIKSFEMNEKPVVQRNIRMKYICSRHNNK